MNQTFYRDEMREVHPISSLIFFAVVIGITMFNMHTALLLLSFCCGSVYYFVVRKLDGVKGYCGIILLMILCGVVNPLFSHRGHTTLFYLPTGSPVTFEAVFYGMLTGLMIGSMMIWILALANVMTSSRIIATVGRRAPRIATMLSLIFRFIPMYNARAKETRDVLDANNIGGGSPVQKASHVFSITTTWALESSIETAYSMKAREYGSGPKTFLQRQRFGIRDGVVAAVSIAVMAMVIAAFATGNLRQSFYPIVNMKNRVLVDIIFGVFCLIPLIINLGENIRWLLLKRKI